VNRSHLVVERQEAARGPCLVYVAKQTACFLLWAAAP
jgi:hypothetical protein